MVAEKKEAQKGGKAFYVVLGILFILLVLTVAGGLWYDGSLAGSITTTESLTLTPTDSDTNVDVDTDSDTDADADADNSDTDTDNSDADQDTGDTGGDASGDVCAGLSATECLELLQTL
jgi:hypothetical protein